MEPTEEFQFGTPRVTWEEAKRMSPAEKFISGPRLFDAECEMAKAHIRRQHPETDEAQVTEHLRELLRAGRERDGEDYRAGRRK